MGVKPKINYTLYFHSQIYNTKTETTSEHVQKVFVLLTLKYSITIMV